MLLVCVGAGCNFIEGVFPGEVPDRRPWGAGDNDRERSVILSSECWSKFVPSCFRCVRNNCTKERIRVPSFAF